MSNFDYGNARLHAMKSRLLSRQDLEELAAVGSVQGLLNALTKTVYHEAVELSLVQFTGIEALNRAWWNDLVHTINKVRRFFTGRAGKLATWVLYRYDVDNVKAVLRGLSQHAPADAILAGTLPVGQLLPADLAQLARAEAPRAAIDLLATWRIPLAGPLLSLRAEQPGADLFAMELALEHWYFQAGMAAAVDYGSSALRQSLRVGADVANILTAMRLVGLAEVRTLLRQRFQVDDASPLFVGPGSIGIGLLIAAAHQPTISRAVSRLEGTAYGPTLANTLGQYAKTERLSDFETALMQYQLKHAHSLLFSDPLGIGVLIGYVALKTAEINNLHWIAQGLELNGEAERIQAELILTGEL